MEPSLTVGLMPVASNSRNTPTTQTPSTVTSGTVENEHTPL